MKKPALTSDRVYQVHFPYCLKKQPDGRYVVFNREYSPLGFNPRENVDLSKVSYHMEITPELASQLSVTQSVDTDIIYMYNQTTDPGKGEEFVGPYMERVMVLFGLMVW